MSTASTERRVLVLTPSAADGRVLAHLVAGAGLPVERCTAADSLVRALADGAGAAIVAEEALDPDAFQRLCDALAAQPPWSDLPIVLLAAPGHDAGPLAERLSRTASGHLTVLERPVRSSTLLAAVHTALRARQRQYQVRDELARRRAAEAAVRQSEERFRAIFEHVPTGIAIKDWEGRFEQCNAAYAAMLGYAEAELREHDFPSLVHPDDREAYLDAIRRLEAGEIPSFEIENRYVHRDGRPIWVHKIVSILHGSAGTPDRLVALVTDVTERRRADQTLCQSESFYRQTLESIPGMTFTNTPDGACDYVSRQWVEYTGVPAEQQLGDAWPELLHPDDRKQARTAWRDAVAGRRDYDLEYRVRRRDGVYGWFKVRCRAIRDEAGTVVRWIGTAVNVDDLKQAEAALRDNDRRKDEFLAMLAHELRNPLAPIRNSVQVLRQLGPKEPRLERSRDIIVRQVAHLSRLVDDLLDVSRITRGKIGLQKGRVSIGEIVEAAVEAARSVVEQHEQTLSVRVPDAVFVDGDRARLVQVVTNLLTNAAKFSPPGGHITVWCRLEGERIVLAVRDTGVGIAKEAQGRIFELFAQEDRSLERSRGGLGIGLTLVKRLVELHGGAVSVRSEGPGHGAEFSIALPAMGGTGAAEQALRPAARAGGRLRLLVVEDNVDAAESFRMLLEIDGHEVHIAGDGRSGLRAIDELEPDVAFVDLGLPEIDGLTVARRVREQRGAAPFLVAVTGYGREEDKRRAREAGFDEHLTKPVDYEAVRALLARVGQPAAPDPGSPTLH